MAPEETIAETQTTEPLATARAFGSPGARFVLGEELGRGGMGRVVAARDVTLEREVAIKQVLTNDRELIARFEREVRITAQLEHPSIVALHEAGRDSADLPFYVMRRIAGVALAERLAVADGVRARLALVPSVAAVVDAAAFAHARRIIHRDIKPGNIMLGPYGEAYLIDWGIARRLDDPTDSIRGAAPSSDDELTRAGQLFGTVAYMAPEQARGEAVDERADVFALGATLFHVLVGRAPFGGMSAAQRIAHAEDGEPVPLAQLPEEVPRDLVAIVAKAMASDREARYRDAGELASDLRAFLGGQLVAARHYTAAQRAARFLRKHAFAAVAITAVAVAALVFGIVTIRGVVEARREADVQRINAEASAHLERSQRLDTLLQHAASVARADPTRAALMVRPLLRDPDYAPRARDLVAAAAAMGIARGASVRGHLTRAAAMSPNGRRVVTSSAGTMYVFDLDLGEGVELADYPRPIADLMWPEEATVIAIDDSGLVAIDTATGAQRLLAGGSIEHAWYVDARRVVRYVDRHWRELREVALTGGSPAVVASDVLVANGVGDLAVVVGRDALRLLSPAGTQTVLDRSPRDLTHARLLAIKHDGEIAAGYADRVRSWSADGTALRTWVVDVPIDLRYVANQLVAATTTGVWALSSLEVRDRVLLEGAQRTDGHGELSATPLLAETPSGVAYGFTDGRITVGDRFGFRKIPYPSAGIVRLVGSRTSPHLAAVFNNGDVRWWRVQDVAMHVLESAGEELSVTSLCWATRTMIVLTGGASLVVIDRATGRMRTAKHELFVVPAHCHGVVGGAVYATGLGDRIGRVDLATGEIAIVDLPRNFIVDETIGSLFYTRDRELVEVAGGRGPEIVLWTAPAPITGFVGHRGSFVVASARKLHRFERPTRTAVELTDRAPDWLGVDSFGTAYWANGKVMTIQRVEAATPSVRVLSSPPKNAYPQRDDGLMVTAKDGSTWLVTPTAATALDLDVHDAVAVDTLGRIASREPHNYVTIHHVRAGVTYRRFLLGTSSLLFDPDGQLLIMLGGRIAQWRAPALDTPSVEDWLAAATNARLEGGVLSWPTPRKR